MFLESKVKSMEPKFLSESNAMIKTEIPEKRSMIVIL